MYIDGLLTDTRVFSYPDYIISTALIYLGSLGGSSNMYGHITNFRLYDIALTEEEVRLA